MRNQLFALILLTSTAMAEKNYQIIGEDNRVQIKKHSAPIYKTIGQIKFKKKLSGDWGSCTGTLITKRHVLTNGHCVTDTSKGLPYIVNEPSDIYFYPGRLKKGEKPFGVARGVKTFQFKAWIEEGKDEYDVAIIKLDRDLRAPEVELEQIDKTEDLVGRKLVISGYPGDKLAGTMWEDFGTYTESRHDGQSFYHNIDTMPGTSGSIIRYQNSKKKWKVIGVHRGSDAAYFIFDTNVAVTLNKTIFSYIKSWIKN